MKKTIKKNLIEQLWLSLFLENKR